MQRIDFLSFPVDSLTMMEALDLLSCFANEGGFHQIIATNANKLWQMQRDTKLAEIMRSAALVIPEYAVVWGAKRLGTPLKAHIGGVMLLKALLPVAEARGHRLYFLGAREEIVKMMVDKLCDDYPELQIVGWHHGYLTPELERDVIEDINDKRPDMLFVAMGSPRQEHWVWDHRDVLGVPVCMGVGGSFDVLAGIKKDAPAWTRRGFEWLYRLMLDPRNLWKRYLITNPWFVYRVFAEKFGFNRNKIA